MVRPYHHFLLLLVWLLTATAAHASRQKYNLNADWLLYVGDAAGAEATDYDDSDWTRVTLPYAFNGREAFSRDIRQLTDTVTWYRKHFRLSHPEGRKVLVEFEGVRQGGEFYLNGHRLGLHENGVMAVGFDLTPYIRKGDNVLAVRTDNDWDYRERGTGSKFQWNDRNFNANYGGLPKNVYLHVTDGLVYQTLPLYSHLGTTGVYVYATDMDVAAHRATVHAEAEVRNESGQPCGLRLQVVLTDPEGREVARFEGERLTVAAGATATARAQRPVEGLHFWSWGYGYLYTVRTRLVSDTQEVVDEVSTRTGFRHTRFAEGKVWLNGRVLQLKGYAQRTSNEWPAVGLSVPAWLSDYSNGLMVESGANLVRWMHVTPWKQDVESCDRVGLIEAMPAGDAEKDREGRQWEQRMELMRDAIIYNRNNPSILFYECGNHGISTAHMAAMRQLRDRFDPYGGRAIGSREMLADSVAEYGGEMLYINKSARQPFWAMEYCRDEGVRKYWDAFSYPYHSEGQGRPTSLSAATNQQKRIDPAPYNHNQDELAIEMVRRWYDYWRERPGQGRRVSAGGVKIIFSDSNTHFRGEENYRTSGVVDAMRIAKDAFFAHQVMWNGWVDTEQSLTHLIGHWNYPAGTVKPVHVVSNADSVRLFLNGTELRPLRRSYHFLFTADSVAYQPGTLVAVSYDSLGRELSRSELQTAGRPAALRLSLIESPEGLQADGADLALVEAEVVDSAGRRCPLDDRVVSYTLEGPAQWLGGIAHGRDDNYIGAQALPVECGVGRVLLRSTTKGGRIRLTARADGLPAATLSLTAAPVAKRRDGLSLRLPQLTLPVWLTRGETPASPSYRNEWESVGIEAVEVGANATDAPHLCDDDETTSWQNDGRLATAWATFSLQPTAEPSDGSASTATVERICLKMDRWRSVEYPLIVLADGKEVWRGTTERSLGYVHIELPRPVQARTITLRLAGSTAPERDAFGGVVELAANDPAASKTHSAAGRLAIVEAEFLHRTKFSHIH